MIDLYSWIFDTPISDFLEWLVDPTGGVAYAISTPIRLFDKICNLFFNFLDLSKPMFIDFGNHAINTFAFSLTDNFFNTVIGIIFGFFVFKFALGKVIDLIGRWLDPL